jgi:cysteine desulfuration protein SufE
MDYPKIFKEVTEDLNNIPDQKEKLEYLMDIGKESNELKEEYRIEENLVPGCISKVYIRCIKENEILFFEGFADSLIVKGYVRILCSAFSGISQKEFMEKGKEYIERFVKESKIVENLLPSRANVFGNVFSMMQKKAS